jgi:hypothetical protein
LLVQVEEGLVVAIEVEEIEASLPPVAAAVTREERSVSEMATPQARLEPLAGAGSGDDDVVMVLADQGMPPPPLTRDHEAAMPEAPETLAATAAPSIGGAEDVPTSGCWSILGVEIRPGYRAGSTRLRSVRLGMLTSWLGSTRYP